MDVWLDQINKTSSDILLFEFLIFWPQIPTTPFKPDSLAFLLSNPSDVFCFEDDGITHTFKW